MNGILRILMIKYKKINKCQISGDKNLDMILSLGLIPPVNQMSHIKVRPKQRQRTPKVQLSA